MKYILLLLISSSAMAQKDTLINLPMQDGKIFYEHVYQDSATKEQLFLNAKEAFISLFPDAKQVIQNEDKDNGVISGIGYFYFNNKVGPLKIMVNQMIRNTIRITVKEGKYRVQIFDFYVKNDRELPMELFYNAEMERKEKKSYKYFSDFNKRVLQSFDQIETEMNKKSTDF